MKTLGKIISVSLKRLAAIIAVLVVLSPSVVMALPAPAEDINSIDIDTVHFKGDYANEKQPITPCSTTTAGGGTVTAGSVYYVGDSIGAQILPGLNTAFSTGGWTFKGNALAGRNLKTGTVQPDGIAAVTADAAAVNNASYIIVELGTNQGGFTTGNVDAMFTLIRSLAPSAKIYWVDTAVVNRPSYAAGLNGINSIIYNKANQLNFNVISWNKKVFGPAASPIDMIGGVDSNSYINLQDNLNVHLTGAGITAMTDLVGNSVKGLSTTTAPDPTLGCSCTSTLGGIDNRQKIFFYLLSKGLTPVQAAGMMGNMQGEAHFEPRLVEYGWPNSRGEISRAGSPTSLDDNVPPDQPPKGQPGYGIVQWTAGRKQPLRDLAILRTSEAGKTVFASDLNLQLDNLWRELTTSYNNSVLVPIQASTDLRLITDIFLRKFEVPGGDLTALLNQRFKFAQTILAELGPLTTPTAPGAAGGGCLGPGELPPGGPTPIIAGDTTNIPCGAGADFGIADGYKNGQLVKIRICRVQGTVVNSQVAKNVDDMYNAATAASLDLGGGGFRTMDGQIAIYLSWCKADGITPSPPPYPKLPGQTIRCPGGGAPGYSNHQMGLAIDMTCAGKLLPKLYPGTGVNACFDWLVNNAAKYGFVEFGRGTPAARAKSASYEAWHWSVDGN